MNPELARLAREVVARIDWPQTVHWARVALDASIALIVAWGVVRRLTWTNAPVFGLTRGLNARSRAGKTGAAIAFGLPAIVLDLALLLSMVSPLLGLRRRPPEDVPGKVRELRADVDRLKEYWGE